MIQKNLEVCQLIRRRKEFKLSLDDYVFVSVGQLSKRKNHEVAIRALAKNPDESIKYIIVGLGELETYLKKLAIELGIENRVFFAGFRTDVAEILQMSDAVLFPSLQEGLPVALMEGMAIGLPVICSRIRGNTDLVENEKGGYVFDSNDIDGFSYGIKRMAHNKNSVIMGSENRKKMELFDIKTVEKEMIDIYQEALEAK